MKCAYSAGILDRFLDDKITFDYCIGVSAGAANTLSYLAGQRGRNLRFYTVHLDDPRYLSVRSLLRTGNLFGLEYIYGTLTNSDGADPIDYDAIMKNPAEFYMPATDALTGKAAYFSKFDIVRDDYRTIMATCALPAFCRPVNVNGHFYYDGGVADSIPLHHAIEQGCTKMVVRTRLRQGCHHPVKSARFREAAGGTPADLQAHAAQISQDHRRDRPPPYQLSGFD
jgi:predicted patatin/cPLA2 family phospholipase